MPPCLLRRCLVAPGAFPRFLCLCLCLFCVYVCLCKNTRCLFLLWHKNTFEPLHLVRECDVRHRTCQVDTYAFGQSIWPADPAASDMTALGWVCLCVCVFVCARACVHARPERARMGISTHTLPACLVLNPRLISIPTTPSSRHPPSTHYAGILDPALCQSRGRGSGSCCFSDRSRAGEGRGRGRGRGRGGETRCVKSSMSL